MADRTCSVPGCERRHAAKGLCKLHYYRLRRTGEVGGAERIPTGPKRVPAEVRFWQKVVKGPDCWEWTGFVTRGYGYLGKGGSSDSGTGTHLVHRFSYELHVGPIPEGLTIDHLCANTRCVNPAHLEPVTLAENTRRAAARRRARKAG